MKKLLLVFSVFFLGGCMHTAGFYQSGVNGIWYWYPDDCPKARQVGEGNTTLACVNSSGELTGKYITPAPSDAVQNHLIAEQSRIMAIQGAANHLNKVSNQISPKPYVPYRTW